MSIEQDCEDCGEWKRNCVCSAELIAHRAANEVYRRFAVSSDRLRAAMAGMANVMACVRSAIYEQRDELRDWQDAQRESSECLHAGCWQPEDRERMSALWSKRVREGVAKLQPAVRVYCQSEEDT